MKNSSSQKNIISPMKKLFFGVIFFSLLVLTLEILLSFAGLERYDHQFMPRSSYPIFVPDKEQPDTYVTSPHFETFINKQPFRKVKPAGLTRIFIVGGSAAYGFPYTEEYGFSGYLRRALEKAAPGRFEVINAAGMSFGSHRVLDVLKDVVKHDPDLVIVYSGNNEYVERNILPAAKTAPAAAEKIRALLDRTDIYRAVRLALFRAAPKVFERRMKQDITDIRTNPQVARGDIGRSPHTDAAILENYRNNITAMKELLVRQGVKGVFCAVPVDVGGWLPTSGLPQFVDESAANRWLELVEARDRAFAGGDIAREVELMRQILEITPDDPGMLFNYGKILWALGERDQSYQTLVKAKDHDARPVRALSSFNRVIRETVDAKNGISLADLENRIREQFVQGQGNGIFLDYCHFTETGNKLAAQWLLPAIQAIASPQLDIQYLSGLIREDARAATKNDYVRGHELYAMGLTFENNNRFDLAVKTYQQALAFLPEFDHIYTNLGHIYVEQGDRERAVAMYDRALTINPRSHKVLLSLGYISIQEGRFDQAESYFAQAIDISPILPGAYSGLGEVAMHRQEFRQAVKYYNETLRLGDDNVWLRKSLAQAYLALGDKKNAVLNWKKVLRFNPLDPETRALLEQYSRGDTQ